MSDEDRRVWATNFHGQDAADGFLVLDADPPLTLARAGEHAGPELEFWLPDRTLSGILLFAGECRPHEPDEDVEHIGGLAVSRSEGFASWCLPEASMEVHVYQEAGDTFIDDVLTGLDIRQVNLAPRPPPQ